MQKTLFIFVFALVFTNAMLTNNRFRAKKVMQSSLKAGTLSAGTVSSGSFTLSATVPSTNSAVSYQFLEGSTVLQTASVDPDCAVAQTATFSVSGKAAGTYTYYFVLWDSSCGSALSNAVTVTVPSTTTGTTASTGTTTTGSTSTTTTTSTSSGYPAWKAGTTYKAGDIISYNGKNYKCVIGHTAIVSWEPTNATTLWSQV